MDSLDTKWYEELPFSPFLFVFLILWIMILTASLEGIKGVHMERKKSKGKLQDDNEGTVEDVHSTTSLESS